MMKLSKKVLAAFSVAAMLVCAGTFVACSEDESGEGSTEGDKNETTMTVDGTTEAATVLEDNKYRRYWSQIGSGYNVAEVTTTLTIDTDKCHKESNASGYVAGYVFDLHKNSTENSKFDMCLLGINIDTKNFYVEHYSGLEELKSLDTSENSLGTESNDDKCNYESDVPTANNSYNGWKGLAESYYTKSGNVYTFPITLKQSTKGTYEVYLNDNKVATYTGKNISTSGATKDYAVGAIGCYGNVGKGNKIVATYTTESITTGSFFDEIVEE